MTLNRHNLDADQLPMAVAAWSSRLELAQICTEAMRALGENKFKVRIFTGGGHGQSVDILEGMLRYS